MHLEQVLEAIGHDFDPVAYHAISAGAIPLEVRRVPRRVHELEPLGDPEPDRLPGAGEKRGQRWLNSQTTSAKSMRPLPL